MAATVVYKDKGLIEILARVAKSATIGARVGVVGAEADRIHPLRGDLTIGEVAMINEMGSPAAGVPQRSFLRSTFDQHRSLVEQAKLAAVKVVFAGESAVAALHTAGQALVKEVVKTIDRGVPPPQAQSTIDKKGHDHTLIDTHTLRDSINSDVVSRSGVLEEIISGGAE